MVDKLIEKGAHVEAKDDVRGNQRSVFSLKVSSSRKARFPFHMSQIVVCTSLAARLLMFDLMRDASRFIIEWIDTAACGV